MLQSLVLLDNILTLSSKGFYLFICAKLDFLNFLRKNEITVSKWTCSIYMHSNKEKELSLYLAC